MKRLTRNFTILAACVLLTFGTATTALAADATGITVGGKGVVTAMPDTTNFSVNISATEKTGETAQRNANKLVTKVTNALVEAGIAKDDVITSYTYLSPNYSYDSDVPKITGYRAYTSLSVTTKDIDNVGDYIDVAIKAGATGVGGVSFYLEDTAAAYAQALQLAVKNSQLSATAIAGAYNKSLGTIVSVVENSYGSYTYADDMETMAEAPMDSGANVAKGRTEISYDKIEVYANITANYAFGN